jgi:predicted nucleic-acid-binding protein
MKITADTTVLVRAVVQDDSEQAPAQQGLGPCQEGNALRE